MENFKKGDILKGINKNILVFVTGENKKDHRAFKGVIIDIGDCVDVELGHYCKCFNKDCFAKTNLKIKLGRTKWKTEKSNQ